MLEDSAAKGITQCIRVSAPARSQCEDRQAQIRGASLCMILATEGELSEPNPLNDAKGKAGVR